MKESRRVSVNFKSDLLLGIVNKHPGSKSMSSFIEERLLECLNKEIEKLEKNANRNEYNLFRERSEKFKNRGNLKFSLTRGFSLRENGKKDIIESESPCFATFTCVVPKTSAVNSGEIQAKNTYRQIIKQAVEEDWDKGLWKDRYPVDMVLLFIISAKIACTSIEKEKVIVEEKEVETGRVLMTLNITAELHFIPFMFPSNEHILDDELLDFDFFNVAYRRYRDVAINGWNKNKYNQIIHITTTPIMTGGGYFIGYRNVPMTKQELIDEVDKLKYRQFNESVIFNSEGVVKTRPSADKVIIKGQTIVKLHYSEEIIKINNASFKSRFDIFNSESVSYNLN